MDDCPSSGYVIEHEGTRVWVDAGTGTFAQLQRWIDHIDIDAIVITHVHSDHCLDLFPLYYARRFDPRIRDMPLYCPERTLEHLSPLLISDSTCTLDMMFDFHEVGEDDDVELGGMHFSFMRTQHPIPTNAVRAETKDQVLTFSSDSGPDAALDDFASGSDAFLCEATYQNDCIGAPLHLSAAQAADFAKRAAARALILTHIFPGLDPVKSVDEAKATAGDVAVHRAYTGGLFDIEGAGWLDA